MGDASRRGGLIETARKQERAILVGVDTGRSAWPLDQSLAELARLVETDGAEVVGTITQRLDHPSSATFIGKGKVEELVEEVRALEADVVVFDEELSPSQQAKLEKAVGKDIKIIDRTALILDIFGIHATTSEGRLQVQLAQLQYLLPRLRGMWSHLVGEQTRGGIGSRFGQGESQLEVDRRLIRKRISTLKRELVRLEGRRAVQTRARNESGVFRVALCGYTNAGKSTLLNRLCNEDVYAKDELFATLDPTTRQFTLAEGRKITLTDTVGFIQKLPTTLVEAFKSTLSELTSADLILKVADAHDANLQLELEACDEVLEQIGADEVQSLLVLNKCDLIEAEELSELRIRYPDAVFISALDGRGIDALLHRIALEASAGDEALSALIPYGEASLAHLIHESCQIIRESYEAEGLLVTLRAPRRLAASLERYRVDSGEGEA